MPPHAVAAVEQSAEAVEQDGIVIVGLDTGLLGGHGQLTATQLERDAVEKEQTVNERPIVFCADQVAEQIRQLTIAAMAINVPVMKIWRENWVLTFRKNSSPIATAVAKKSASADFNAPAFGRSSVSIE